MNCPRPSRISQPVKCNQSVESFLRRRELGLRAQFGTEDFFSVKLYSAFDKFEVVQKPRPLKCEEKRKYGGVFNLEYSTDGRILVAACEEKSILLYDASTQRCIKCVSEAHSNCVNCIRFLDSRTFATCSDDTTIKLWDLRNLRRETRTLHGHENWVKNIEYLEPEKTLVTSAFDGSVYKWNLKDDNINNTPYQAVFHMNGIMRTKLSPDGTKMVISTTSGYMIIIHNLNVTTLANDLRNFRPNLYRLMQLTEQNFPAGNIYNYLFDPSRRRNRVEFIDDFPNKAEVVSSLQIHPHGWCCLSRNINSEESEDWTSVHDIQLRDPSDYENHYVHVNEYSPLLESENNEERKPSDLWIAYVTNDQYNYDRESTSSGREERLPPMSSMNSGLIGRNAYKAFLQRYPEYQNKIAKNFARLTHYVKEQNAGKGYIKEVCFSPDGRAICSPYNKGIRVMGFSENAQELPYCLNEAPKELCKFVEMNDYHQNVVVCCKFNPVLKQLVSGCLGGDIVWYESFLT